MPIGRAASNEENEPQSAATRTLVAILDQAINRSNQLSFWGISYKPYWLMCDVATVLALAYAFLFSTHFPSISSVGLIMA